MVGCDWYLTVASEGALSEHRVTRPKENESRLVQRDIWITFGEPWVIVPREYDLQID